MRSIWNGSILFGEVVIPVGLVPTRRDGGVSFRQLHRDCGMPLKQSLACPIHGVLEEPEIVKGYEIAEGQYVTLEQADLEAIAPEASKQIALQALVPADELDELSLDTSYFLKPSTAPIAARSYVLLTGVLRELDMVALVRLVAFGSEWIAGIRPLGSDGPTLILQRLVPTAERVDHAELEQLLVGVTVTEQEGHLGRELGRRQFTHLAKKPELLENTHRDRVLALVDARLAGQPIVHSPRPEPTQTQIPAGDLADVLTRSIHATRKRRPPSPRRKPAAARKR